MRSEERELAEGKNVRFEVVECLLVHIPHLIQMDKCQCECRGFRLDFQCVDIELRGNTQSCLVRCNSEWWREIDRLVEGRNHTRVLLHNISQECKCACCAWNWANACHEHLIALVLVLEIRFGLCSNGVHRILLLALRVLPRVVWPPCVLKTHKTRSTTKKI